MRLIRFATPDDGAAASAIYRPAVEQSATSFEAEPPDAATMAGRIAAALEVAPWLVLCDDSGVSGYAYAGRHRERHAYRFCVDVSVYVRGDRRRAGVGRALYTSLLSLLRLQGFRAAHAGVTLPNAASVGLHQSFGFQPVGVYRAVGWKLGAWHDVGWFQLELLPRTGEPAPLLSMAALLAHPDFAPALAAGAAPRAPHAAAEQGGQGGRGGR